MKLRFPTKATCLTIYSRVVNARGELKDDARQMVSLGARRTRTSPLFASYVEMKQRQNVLDYDDLLLYFAQMLAESAIAAEIAGRFDHLLVDEYQDTNALQGEIVLALRPEGRGLTVVGDDAQAIYSFRAATVRNILDFPRAFDPPAHVVTLERNYRSSGADSRRRQRGNCARARTFRQDPVDRAAHGRLPLLVTVADDADQARFVATRVLANRESGARSKARRSCSAPPTTAPRSNSSSPAATCRSSSTAA